MDKAYFLELNDVFNEASELLYSQNCGIINVDLVLFLFLQYIFCTLFLLSYFITLKEYLENASVLVEVQIIYLCETC